MIELGAYALGGFAAALFLSMASEIYLFRGGPYKRGLALVLLVALCCGMFPFPGFTSPQPASLIVLTRATNVGTSGGNVTIIGTGFDTPTVQFKTAGGAGPWMMCGASQACTPISASSTQIIVNIQSLSASDYDVLVSNVGGATAYSPGLLTVTASSTPSTIGGANLILWWRATDDTNTGNGTNTTAIVDKSGTGNTPTTLTAVTHNNSSSNFNNQPTWSFNGTSSTLLVGSLNLTTGNTVHCTMAVRLGAAGTNPTFWGELASTLRGSASTSVPQMVDNVIANWTTSVLNTSVNLEAYIQKTGASSVVVGIAVNGQTLVTTAGTGVPPGTTGDTNSFGSANVAGAATSPYAQMELAEVACFDAILNGTQRTQMAAYYNLRYQLAPNPVLSSTCGVGGTSVCATNVASTSAGAQSWRVNGANFVSGIAAEVDHPGGGASLGTVTTTFVSSTIAEMSLPAATYTVELADITLSNPDGGMSTQLGAINVTATLDPMQMMGASCLGWWAPNQVTQSGGTISAMVDQSLRGTTLTFTSVGYTATNSTFGNAPSADFNGTTSFATVSSVPGMSNSDPLFLWNVFYKNSGNGVNAQMLNYAGTDEYRHQVSTSTPGMLFGSTTTAWGSTVTNTSPHLFYSYESGGSSWTQGVCLDCTSTASEVTASVTSTALQAGVAFTIGKRAGGNFFNGSMAAFGICHALPTTTQRQNLEAWAHAAYATP